MVSRALQANNGKSICPICLGDRTRWDRPYKGSHKIFVGKSLCACEDCGLVFADPLPSAGEWDVYNSAFFSESESGLADDHPAIPFFEEVARIRLRHIEARISPKPMPSAVLEIGPGPGYFCQAYIDRNPGVRYRAVETDPVCYDALRARGVEAVGDLAEIASSERFGLLVMSHVLEHSLDPRQFLIDATGLLEPGGALFIEVPCRDFEYKPVFDAHVLFFDKNSMGRLLDETGLVEPLLSYHGEAIDTLRRQLSFGYKLQSRFAAALRRFIPGKGSASDERVTPADRLEEALALFRPHVEHDRPARWLRAMAVKPEHGE
jgi:SAM-dependent methyltransferase